MQFNSIYFQLARAILFLAASTAQAQTQTQTNTVIYAVMDAGVRSASGLGMSATSSPSGSPYKSNAIANGVDRSGRFGISGTETWGAGYAALFVLESELYLNTGNVNPNLGAGKDTSATTANKLFDRQATVGIATPYGQILLGRQQSVIRDVIDDIDAINGRFTAFNPNLQYTALNSSGLVSSAVTYYGTGNAGNDSMMRQDNALKVSNTFGAVNISVDYSFGGLAANSQAGSSTQGNISYKDKYVFVAAAYQALNNNNDTLKLKASTIGGRVILGDWQVALNYGSNIADRTTAEQIKTAIYSIGTTYAASSKIDLTLGYYDVNRSWTGIVKPDACIKRLIGFAEYKFSNKTLGFVEFDHNKWGGDVTQFQNGATNKSTTNGITLGLDYKM